MNRQLTQEWDFTVSVLESKIKSIDNLRRSLVKRLKNGSSINKDAYVMLLERAITESNELTKAVKFLQQSESSIPFEDEKHCTCETDIETEEVAVLKQKEDTWEKAMDAASKYMIENMDENTTGGQAEAMRIEYLQKHYTLTPKPITK